MDYKFTTIILDIDSKHCPCNIPNVPALTAWVGRVNWRAADKRRIAGNVLLENGGNRIVADPDICSAKLGRWTEGAARPIADARGEPARSHRLCGRRRRVEPWRRPGDVAGGCDRPPGSDAGQ